MEQQHTSPKPKRILPLMEEGRLNTIEEVRAWFERNGVAQAEWCREYSINRSSLAMLLSPSVKSAGKRGQAFRAAVAIGIRKEPDVDFSTESPGHETPTQNRTTE